MLACCGEFDGCSRDVLDGDVVAAIMLGEINALPLQGGHLFRNSYGFESNIKILVTGTVDLYGLFQMFQLGGRYFFPMLAAGTSYHHRRILFDKNLNRILEIVQSIPFEFFLIVRQTKKN